MIKFVMLYLMCCNIYLVLGKKHKENEKPDWAKKDIRDYTDADMERLLEQWEEDDEPLEPDELPEHLRPAPPLDLSKMNPNDPEGMLQATKKGRTLMTFVQVAGTLSKDETEELTKLWQTSLWNNHIQAERYLVGDNRAIFLFKDGSQAWVAKDYLIEQEKCESVTIESKVYPGKFSKNTNKEEL
ncbi:LDLR chaperone boca [Diorhabda carinulata]|uniref:LDLR chaperone boca n=1 Tax=Diorhabda carinulata TaxID=1163345 RepID=UPI0025A25D4E|nr:LDLR chaperone boca [Diorhabda carinulata]